MTASELSAAYRLVHDIFVAEGYILPDPSGIRIRLFEAFPEMATFIGEADGQVVGVMGIVPDTSTSGLPSDRAFHHELGVLRAQGLCLSEVTNLALRPDYRRTNLFFDLSRACFAEAMRWHCDRAFVSLCPRHQSFFQDVLHFDLCGHERSYSSEVVDLVIGMAMDFGSIEQRFIATDQLLGDAAFLHDSFCVNNPFHERCRRWADEASTEFANADLLTELFVRSSALLGRCSPKELETVEHWWGTELFERVHLHSEVAQAPRGDASGWASLPQPAYPAAV